MLGRRGVERRELVSLSDRSVQGELSSGSYERVLDMAFENVWDVVQMPSWVIAARQRSATYNVQIRL